MVIRILTWKLFLFVSVIGFAFQIFHVSRQYFAYATVPLTTLRSAGLLVPRNIALCFRYNDILDIRRLKKETGIRIVRLKDNESLQDAIENESMLTIRQIFNYTPSSENIIDHCMHRPDDWDIAVMNGTECHETLQTSRFFMQENMCYVLRDVAMSNNKLASVTRSTYYGHIINEVVFNQNLSSGNVITVISFTGSFPWLERRVCSPPATLFNDKGKKKNNFLTVTQSDTYYVLLESPYDTHCQHRHHHEKYECMHNCLMLRMAKHDRVPTWEPIEERLDMKPFTLTDARNLSFRSLVESYESFCDKKCFFKSCNYNYTRTKATLSYHGIKTVGVALTTPVDPNVNTKYTATMTFIDFFTYICSCFGTWFGLSFLSLNPLRHLMKRNINRRSVHEKVTFYRRSFRRAGQLQAQKWTNIPSIERPVTRQNE